MAIDGPELAPRRLTRRDALACALLFMGSLALYTALRQPALQQDGPGLVEGFLYGEPPYCPHAAYMPLARALEALLDALSGGSRRRVDVLWWLSSLGGALGVACTFALARALGARAASALGAALTCALARAVVYHATVVELHALHFGVAAAAALASVLALRARALVWTSVFALSALALYTTHKTALFMFPGWALLPWALRRDARVRTLAASASALGVGGLAALQLTRWRSGDASAFGDVARNAQELGRFASGFDVGWLVDELALGLGALVALGALGAWQLRRERSALVLALLIGVPYVFFALWGVRNEGGYLLGALPFVALAAARADLGVRAGAGAARSSARAVTDRGASPSAPRTGGYGAVLAGALAVQVALLVLRPLPGWPSASTDSDGEQRTAAIERALGGAGYAIGADRSPYPAHLSNASIRELRVNTLVPASADAAQATAALTPFLDALVAREPGRVAAVVARDDASGASWIDYGRALRATCEARYACRVVVSHGWTVLVLAPRK